MLPPMQFQEWCARLQLPPATCTLIARLRVTPPRGECRAGRATSAAAIRVVKLRFKGSWPCARIFCAGWMQVYGVTGTSAMMQPLAQLVERVPHGDDESAEQARGPLAFGARGGPPAQRGCPHRDLLPSAPGACPGVWPGSGGPGPGDSRWSSCPLEGGGTSGGTWAVPPAPARPPARLAPR
jgi:hypothetical protein